MLKEDLGNEDLSLELQCLLAVCALECARESWQVLQYLLLKFLHDLLQETQCSPLLLGLSSSCCLHS